MVTKRCVSSSEWTDETEKWSKMLKGTTDATQDLPLTVQPSPVYVFIFTPATDAKGLLKLYYGPPLGSYEQC